MDLRNGCTFGHLRGWKEICTDYNTIQAKLRAMNYKLCCSFERKRTDRRGWICRIPSILVTRKIEEIYVDCCGKVVCALHLLRNDEDGVTGYSKVVTGYSGMKFWLTHV
ncbi:hypothetical protein LR48_Vigan08g120600 [Vigna angularis]|uniref:Uncharacterized protein n=1 Tax=Phaseolus angularis TaxID=3914 RepID=A0A0L9V6S9_PHAAN|nr:hypothetical protein LR48_Vigan08g120600 [Vigna angularis]